IPPRTSRASRSRLPSSSGRQADEAYDGVRRRDMMSANERQRVTKMQRWLTTLAVFAVCTAAVHADVTIVQTTTIEGGMAAMSGQAIAPKTTSRIKGKKARNDIDAQMIQVTTIADLDANQVIVLRHDQKTAQILTPATAGAAIKNGAAGLPAIDASLKAT